MDFGLIINIIVFINIYIYLFIITQKQQQTANGGQNHTVQHNTAQSSQIKKGTYIHSN